MRLTQYMNESSFKLTLETILVTLYKNCLPYLKELHKEYPNHKKGNMFFLSGRGDSRDIFKKDIRIDRQPKDMPYEAHEALNDAFENEFGVPYRSESIFVTGNENTASGYGDNVYMIFPTDKYSYIWSNDVTDLYSDSNDGQDFIEIESGYDIEEYIMDDFREDAYNRLSDQWQERFGDDDGDGHWEYESTDDEDEVGDARGNENEKLEDFESRISDEEDKLTYSDQFVWYPMVEMDDYIDDEIDDLVDEMVGEYIIDRNNEISGNIGNVVGSYTEGRMKQAIDSGSEIMLSGKGYIAIRHDLYEPVLRMWFSDHSYKDIKRYQKDLKSKKRDEAIAKLEAWYKSKGKRMPRQLNLFDK